MVENILYTYENYKEFKRVIEELLLEGIEVLPFNFGETKGVLEENNRAVIDITRLVEYLRNAPYDKQIAVNNFITLGDSHKIIVRADLAELSLEYFWDIFSRYEPLYREEKDIDIEWKKLCEYKRKIIYTYEKSNQLDEIIKYTQDNSVMFLSYTKLIEQNLEDIKKYLIEGKRVIFDITTLERGVENNPQLIYLFEQLAGQWGNFDTVIQEKYLEKALEDFCMIYSDTESIEKLLKDIMFTTKVKKEKIDDKDIRKVTVFNNEQIEQFLYQFNNQLIGHNKFKCSFEDALLRFRIMNKIGNQKILSIFLLGQSGIGKTEVARIINNLLDSSSKLIKINFGNYSSQDALNSLIGSPRGYIGCEQGELGSKLEKATNGIILCDEFEKANYPVFNFFLQLLEDGEFTDSMNKEYKLDGYIIIFTSNLSEQQFYKQIPTELQSRIDLVCKFMPLKIEEKKKFINKYIEDTIKKLEDNDIKIDKQLLEREATGKIELENIEDLRQIRREIDSIIKKVVEKDIGETVDRQKRQIAKGLG
nr:AAA family ATPase [uncultured Niameybacter sp.]